MVFLKFLDASFKHLLRSSKFLIILFYFVAFAFGLFAVGWLGFRSNSFLMHHCLCFQFYFCKLKSIALSFVNTIADIVFYL